VDCTTILCLIDMSFLKLFKIMMITVVIPYCNNSTTLRKTLLSLSHQTRCEFEVIIVDDCSDDKDKLTAIVKEFAQRLSLSVIHHNSRKNGAAARNTGVENAIGEFVAFLDADDTWYPTRIEHLQKLVNEKTICDNTLLYGKVNLFRGDQFLKSTPYRSIYPKELVCDYVFASCQMMQTSSFVCSRMLAKTVQFDERFTRHQDSSFAMKTQALGFKLYFDEHALVNYYFPENGLKQRISEGRINANYCDYWLREMAPYLSKSAVNGYKLFVKSRVLYSQNMWVETAKSIGKNLWGIRFSKIQDILIGLGLIR
jgi:glycosyltransferase involved in cell wall biosynthesis